MSERINIKNLTLEEPEKQPELSFDPERDITEKDFEDMEGTLRVYQLRGNWPEALASTAALKLISSERTSELHWDEKTRQKIKDEVKAKINYHLKRGDFLHVFHLAMEIQTLFPHRVSDFGPDKRVWEDTKQLFDSQRSRHGIRGVDSKYLFFIAATKFLFPHKIPEFNLDTEVWNKTKEYFEQQKSSLEKRHKQWGATPGRENDWYIFSLEVVAMKFLFPEKTSELTLDPGAWDEMKKSLEYARPILQNQPGFARMAMVLKLLAAEEVKITENGLEIIMQKEEPEFKEETPPMPQRRKF